MKPRQSPREMSPSSLRAELLDLLAMRFPEKEWPKLVSGRELADFALQNFRSPDVDSRSQRTLHLADELQRKRRRR